MLEIDDLEPFLRAAHPSSPKIPDSAVLYNNRLPAEPDKEMAISITEIDGPRSMDVEQAFDVACVMIRTRAPKGDNRAARLVARSIDRRVMDDEIRPFHLGGHYVLECGRLGGAPHYLGTDHQNRANYACPYFFRIAR